MQISHLIRQRLYDNLSESNLKKKKRLKFTNQLDTTKMHSCNLMCIPFSGITELDRIQINSMLSRVQRRIH